METADAGDVAMAEPGSTDIVQVVAETPTAPSSRKKNRKVFEKAELQRVKHRCQRCKSMRRSCSIVLGGQMRSCARCFTAHRKCIWDSPDDRLDNLKMVITGSSKSYTKSQSLTGTAETSTNKKGEVVEPHPEDEYVPPQLAYPEEEDEEIDDEEEEEEEVESYLIDRVYPRVPHYLVTQPLPETDQQDPALVSQQILDDMLQLIEWDDLANYHPYPDTGSDMSMTGSDCEDDDPGSDCMEEGLEDEALESKKWMHWLDIEAEYSGRKWEQRRAARVGEVMLPECLLGQE